jgi:hypothetical protein
MFVLLGITLLAGAGIAKLADLQSAGPSGPALVRVSAVDADGRERLNETVSLAAGDANVLVALRRAADRAAVAVQLQDYPGIGIMVVAIDGIRNDGACGWVYEVDGRSGDRSAANYPLQDGAHVRWFWSCHR